MAKRKRLQLTEELIEACKKGRSGTVQKLISKGADPSYKDWRSGMTPLHWASRSGHLDVVKLLITNGHCNLKRDGSTLLHEACRFGHLSVVEYLISEGHCDVNIVDSSGKTPLHGACRNGLLDIVKMLITNGHCDINSRDKYGNTPLHEACREGHLKIVECLISEGHCDVKIENIAGEIPLHNSCKEGHLKIIQCLISEGHCDVNIVDSSGNTPLHWACKGRYSKNLLNTVKYLIMEGHCDVNISNTTGQTPLHVACKKGHLDMVKLLISDGHCYVNNRNKDGDTPLHEACREGHLSTVKYLIVEGHCDVNISNNSGETPLYVACSNGLLSTVQYLIVEGHCDVNIPNTTGQTPLHVACWKGHLKIVKYLIVEVHCDVNISNNDGWTPLREACWMGHLDIVKLLITDGHCNLNNENMDGDTPLHRACWKGHLSIVEYLIVEGHYDVNLPNRSGQTPLHMACWYGRLDIVMLLITNGQCNVNSTDMYGDTPLHDACRLRHLNIVKYLISEGHCDVNVVDSVGNIPLHKACREGQLNLVKYLSSAEHCDVNIVDSSGDTPLHVAYKHGNFEIAWCLIRDQRCSVKLQFSAARDLLDWAYWKSGLQHMNSEQLRHIILEKDDAEALLLWASRKGYMEVVKYLTSELHCNVQCTDKHGKTALHLACQNDHAEIVHYLLSERLCTVEKDDTTLLNLTNDPSTIRELLRYGANPENVYAQYSSHLPKHSPKQPPESAVKVFTVGDHGAGKSTLVKALEKEDNWFTGRLTKVTGVDEKTAGIIPHKLESRLFGHVALYDFAGHKEFYASHAAMIRQSMAGSSTAIFLLLADLRNNNAEFEASILSWLSFIDNQCPIDPKPHIIIVGSHADEIESKGENAIAKSSILDSLEHRDAFRHFEFRGFIEINCCYSQSTSISELRKRLAKSCEAVRLKSKLSFNTHCFSIYLLDKFRDLEAVKLRDVLLKVSVNSTLAKSHRKNLMSFIPTDAPRLWEMCEDLHDRGSILLLRNTEKPEESWLILDQTTLLKTVPGKVFAPKGFKEHLDLASATGVVPFAKFRGHFPTLDPDMVAQFLCHLEFCQEVTDNEVLQLLQTPLSISCKESVFFFPSLVSIDAPELQQYSAAPACALSTQIWKPNSDYVYNSGWVLQCSQAEHHFTPRFLQVLLLRLAFCFALAPHVQENQKDLQEIQREFYVWKSGICWVTRKGVAALVQMNDSGKTVTVLLRCLEHSKIQCIHLRSAIIHKTLCTEKEFCPKVSTSEYFIHPDAVEYPLKPTSELNLFSISHVTRAFAAGDPCIIGKDSQPLHLEKLLYFEPYFHLSKAIVQELFDEEKASLDVDSELIDRIAKCFRNKCDDVFNILRLQDSTVMEDTPPSPDQAIVRLLQLWQLHSRKGNYQWLRRKLDQFSVFAGRHPLSPTTSSLSAQSTTETASEVDLTTDNYSTLIDSVDETTLDITALHSVNNELVSVAPKWLELGLSLGLEQTVLDALESNYPRDVNRCLTETLARWLQQVRTARSWRAITHALIVSSINRVDLAHSIATSHGISTPKQHDTRYEDVSSEPLDISNLGEVLIDMFSICKWFELGLSLGLSYHRLTIIEEDNPQNTYRCKTEMLTAWLKGVGGESSWRQLACALDSPFIQKTELATIIATEHRV